MLAEDVLPERQAVSVEVWGAYLDSLFALLNAQGFTVTSVQPVSCGTSVEPYRVVALKRDL